MLLDTDMKWTALAERLVHRVTATGGITAFIWPMNASRGFSSRSGWSAGADSLLVQLVNIFRVADRKPRVFADFSRVIAREA